MLIFRGVLTQVHDHPRSSILGINSISCKIKNWLVTFWEFILQRFVPYIFFSHKPVIFKISKNLLKLDILLLLFLFVFLLIS